MLASRCQSHGVATQRHRASIGRQTGACATDVRGGPQAKLAEPPKAKGNDRPVDKQYQTVNTTGRYIGRGAT